MFKMVCNIDKSDRTNRMVFGGIMVLAALIGFGQRFMFLLGVILLIEGAIGWCGIPLIVERIKAMMKPKKQPPKK